MRRRNKLGLTLPGEQVVTNASAALPFILKTTFLVVLGVVGYNLYTNRFVKLKENSSYGAANISYAQAVGRADAIDKAKGTFFGVDFPRISDQITGLNYNGFIRVYNAFGQRKGTLLGGDLNLIEWFGNQLTSSQMQQLSFQLGGAFF